jgi:hypothetical protein
MSNPYGKYIGFAEQSVVLNEKKEKEMSDWRDKLVSQKTHRECEHAQHFPSVRNGLTCVVDGQQIKDADEECRCKGKLLARYSEYGVGII